MLFSDEKIAMVKENFEKFEEASKDQFLKTKSFRLADPIDRLAAFIIDVGIIFFISILILAPIQKKIQEAYLINDFQGAIFNIFLSWGIASLILIFYWSFFIFYSGSTIGKRIFQIKVISLWPQYTLNLLDAFTRSIIHFFELFFIGVFHLSIFSDPRRRLLHDRLSNTIVVSTSYRKSNHPSYKEAIFAKLLFIFIFIIFLGGIALKIYKGIEYINLSENKIFKIKKCEIIENASKDWPNDKNSRLSVALGLYAAGVIQEDCLKRETHYSFGNEEEMSNAYLAKTFLTYSHAELSNSYIRYICEKYETSEACQFTQFMSLLAEEDWERAKEKLELILPNASAHVIIWGIKYFEKVKDYNKVLELIKKLWPEKYLSEFLGSHRIIALSGIEKYSESEVAFKSISEYLDRTQKYKIASWLCYKQLNKSCNNLTNASCSLVQKNKIQSFSNSNDLYFLLNLRLKSCMGYNKDYKDLLSKSFPSSIKDYLSSLVFESEGKMKQAKKKLRVVIQNEPNNSIISYAAKIKLLDLITEIPELERYQHEWIKSWSIISWDWKFIGQKLMKKLNKNGLYKSSLKVGKFLFKKDPYYQSTNQELVTAYCESGSFKICERLFNKRDFRSPASSQKEYKRLLLRIGTVE